MWQHVRVGNGNLDRLVADRSDDPDPEYEGNAEAIFDELFARRHDWGLADGVRHEAFRWRILGGRWTHAALGVAYDAFKAEASNFAKPWCVAHGLPREKNVHHSDVR